MIRGRCLATNRALRSAAVKFAMVRMAARRYHRTGQAERRGAMSQEDIMRRLELLRVEHRDLDSAIAALVEAGGSDQMQIARLKKRKLRLRDEIAQLEDALVPDIIA